ncbi:MAG: lysozyme [Methylobacterium sp.]|uniref:lysozyme n=1 Tax=Methylobacterium sp. TaxID=409 RepID=UPI0025875B1F|nr:lysozyme [Methylobacterium sp.]MBY0300055.1 lysozyme [Methylobacterium sp.]
MDLSPIGRAALKAREGERLTAYKDSVGIWTIGVGITSASGLIAVTPGLTITAAQSDALFARAVERYAAPVRQALTRPCTQEQFDALVSICFNIGPAAFARATFLRRFNAGDVPGCAAAILAWNKPAEILPRRRAEHDQFLTPYAVALPKARSTDAGPIRLPRGPAPAPASVAPASPAPPRTSRPAVPWWRRALAWLAA